MTFLAAGYRICFLLLALPLFLPAVRATTFTYTGTGGDLNLATFDRTNAVVPGVTTFTISVPDLAFVDPGDSVTLSLAGLQYPFAGDLRVTLQKSNVTGDVFNHIGAFNPGDPGYATQLGNSISLCSGNYNFDSTYSGNLWTTAAGLGSADSIPCGNYFPTTAFSANNDNLSSGFAGLQINGAWTLAIYDDFPPFNGGIAAFVPGLSSWDLTIQAASTSTTPEPATALLTVLFVLLIPIVRRRRTGQAKPYH